MNTIFRLDLGEGSQIFFQAGDITKQSADAIVNAANASLKGGGGVDGAIHRAGGPAILAECRSIVARDGHLPAGEAVQTTGGNLPAAFVIHTVGPIYRDGMHGESGILANCYRNSIRLAERMALHSLAFPSISTGAYRYPHAEAAAIAVATVVDELIAAKHLHEVRFVLFSEEMLNTFLQAAKDLQQRRRAAEWRFVNLSVTDLPEPGTDS